MASLVRWERPTLFRFMLACVLRVKNKRGQYLSTR
jgi:hypothetical protein